MGIKKEAGKMGKAALSFGSGIMFLYFIMTGLPTDNEYALLPPDSVFTIDITGELADVVWEKGDIVLRLDSGQSYGLSRVTVADDRAAGRVLPSGEVEAAVSFIKRACPIGSTVYVDDHDDPDAPYRTGIIWCGDPVSLNQQALDGGHMVMRNEDIRDLYP